MPRPPRSRCPRCSSASSPGWGGAYLLPNLIGIENALEVVISNPLKQNRMLKPQQAFDYGIVDAIFPAANYLEDSLQWADGVLDRHGQGRPQERAGQDRAAHQVADRDQDGARHAREPRSARCRSRPTPRSSCSTRRRAARRPRASPARTRRWPISSPATSSRHPCMRSISCRSARSARSARPTRRSRRRSRRSASSAPASWRASSRCCSCASCRFRCSSPTSTRRASTRVSRTSTTRSASSRPRAASTATPPTGCAHSCTARPTRAEYADCDFVIEAVFEEVGVKQQVFGEIEKIIAEDAILATNTSSLSVEEIGAKLAHPERLVGFHFFNPVAVMPLIEIVKTPQTTDAALSTAFVVARGPGQERRAHRRRPGLRREPPAREGHGRGGARRLRGHAAADGREGVRAASACR